MVNGLGLSLALWFALRLRVLDCAWVRRKVNGLRLGLGLWSGLKLRGVVNGLGLSLALGSGLKLSVRVWA